MDPRPYNYEYRRPRLNNPTYSSYNVNSSLSFFNNPLNLSPRNGSGINTNEGSQSPRSSNYFNNQSLVEGDLLRNSANQQGRDRTYSHLSNYGNQSLAFNERDIFNKQAKKFNIISLKPKQVQDSLKIYPKRTLEDNDKFYYKKVLMMQQQAESLNANNRSGSLPTRNDSPLAGKHTYAPEDGKVTGFYQQPRYFTPKLLNHADEVGTII